MFIKLFIVLSVLCLSCYLFKVASGTLAVNKLNIVSYLFYLFMVQTFLGATLIFLGSRKHYMTTMILEKTTIDKTYFFICYTAIMLPLSIILIGKLFKTNIRDAYSKYLSKEVATDNEENMFLIMLVSAIVCIGLTIYMFAKLGTVPLMGIIFGVKGADVAHVRGMISSSKVMNPYIQNLIVLGLTPTLSFIAFLYAKITKKNRWRILFAALFIASIFVKTYNYAKAPVVFYLIMFVFIIIVTNGMIPMKKIFALGIVCVCIMILMYVRSGYDFHDGIDIYNGPIGRTIFTQVGTLFLHVDMFPKHVSFLQGRSFAPTILGLFFGGMNHVRSGKIVMEFYSPLRVYDGSAGVMNSLFVGEAYANFGLKGALIAPIYIGLLIGAVYLIFMKTKKNPINVIAYISILSMFSVAFQGGFTDFVYNFNLIFTLAVLYSMYFASVIMSKMKIFDNVKKKLKL